jgi:RNA polymerase sigma factor (sigma-70 family)
LYNGPVVKAGSKVRLALASDEWLVACVRRGDTNAFEALYDRHARELLAFSVYMLGSRQDAEDAVQATFASAYRALRADGRAVTLRPWLFTIARNNCLSILRRRRPVVELNGEIAPGPDPVAEIEVREEVRKVFEGLRELPENQRAALILAEVHGLSQSEIGGVLGVRSNQVKAYVYQARSKLISDRRARDADCREIREELASAKGAALLRGRLRRHVRSCPECKLYADGVARQRRQFGALLPIVPPLALKYRALEEALNFGAAESATVAGGAAVGASVAGTAADIAGGGLKVLVCKVAAGMVCLGAGAGVGVSVLEAPSESAAGTTSTQTGGALVASASGPGGSAGWSPTLPAFGGKETQGNSRSGRHGSTDSGLPVVENGSGGGSGGGQKTADPQTSGKHGSSGGGETTAGHGGSSGGGGGGTGRRVRLEQVQLKREIKQRSAEERKQRHEEPKTKGPRLSEQERAEKRELRKLKREEEGPAGHSKAPLTEEELAERKAKHARKIKERREREEREREEAEASPPAP